MKLFFILAEAAAAIRVSVTGCSYVHLQLQTLTGFTVTASIA